VKKKRDGDRSERFFLFLFIKLTRMIGPAGLSFIWNVKMIPKQEGIYLASHTHAHAQDGRLPSGLKGTSLQKMGKKDDRG